MKRAREKSGLAILFLILSVISNLSGKSYEHKKYLMHRPADFEPRQSVGGANLKSWDEIFRQGGQEPNEYNQSSMDIETQFDEGEMVYISNDINTPTIWTCGNIYRIASNINIQSLLVIEPGTTIITYAGDGGHSMFVNNGGCLISCGTPENLITYIGPYSGDSVAIYVQETASPATKIEYNYIRGQCAGIAMDNIRLDTPIQNNYFFGNSVGIGQMGTKFTDIQNNLCIANMHSGIEIYMEKWVPDFNYWYNTTRYGHNRIGDGNSYVLIKNNTFDAFYGDNGIMVHGYEPNNLNNLGFIEIVNNIVSGAGPFGYGLNLLPAEDGETYLLGFVSNTGYYGNCYNQNWEFPQENPVIDDNSIYYYTGGQPYEPVKDCYLAQDSGFINAGLGYIEETPQIGMTTDIYGWPDDNIIDIGFHHPNWYYSNAGITSLQADFDNDGVVDFGDLEIFAEYWLSPFDMVDFSILANEWGETTEDISPAIAISINSDTNNIKGEIGINVTGCSRSTGEVFVLMDGQLLDKMIYEFGETPGLTIDSASYLNGNHTFKAVVTDYNGFIVASQPFDVNFNNPMHCLNMEDNYEPNKPLRIRGFSAGDGNSIVKLSRWWNNEVVWSQQISGNPDLNIPGGFLDGQIYDVSIEHEVTGLDGLYTKLLKLDSELIVETAEEEPPPDWEQIWKKAIAQEYDPNIHYKFAIFLPKATAYISFPPQGDSSGSRKKAVAGIINDCNIMGIKYIVLYKDQCTWQNFRRVLTGPRGIGSDIIYVYLVSRGGSSLGSGAAQRTYFRLTDGYVVSNLDTPIGGRWNNRSDVHPIANLGLGDSDQLKLVWIDICSNGLRSDMANAWMEFSGNQLYVSWNTLIETSNESCYCDWTAFFFGYPNPNKGFGLYGANSYYQAFQDATKWDNVCNSYYISGTVQTYGDTGIRFTPNR